jgi:hypothetical protein
MLVGTERSRFRPRFGRLASGTARAANAFSNLSFGVTTSRSTEGRAMLAALGMGILGTLIVMVVILAFALWLLRRA